MTVVEYTTKICTACGVEKSLASYYRWHSNNKYMPYCKKCHQKRTKRETPIPADTCGVAHQNDLIHILRGMGIYASPGKSSEYAHADVVAWGCVRIEVKLGEACEQSNPHIWKFRFTRKQANGGMVADLIAFMCPDGYNTGGYTCYLIEPTCAEFYRDGKFKPALTVNIGTHRKFRRDGRQSLSPQLLNSHRDNWQVIEQKRIAIAETYQQKTAGI